jgi:heptosyltransferase-2
MSVPALRELQRLLPAAHLTVIAPPGTSDIFAEADFVDDVIVSEPKLLPSVRQLRAGKFDLALLFQNSFASALTSFAARVHFRIGYDTDRRGRLLTTALPVPIWKNERHESFYYLNIISELERVLFRSDKIASAGPRFDLSVSENRMEAARQFLIDNRMAIDKPLAILCPGSVNSRAKRWPAERYAELSDRLIDAGLNVALIGSPGELEVSQQVVSQAKHQPILLTGKTSVAEVVALISIADVLVTNDTGPAHIGAAVGTPTLVIFGPTNPLTTYPFSANSQVIREPPDCAPCMLRDCPIDHRCMTAISAERVFREALVMIHRGDVQLSGQNSEEL